MCCCQSVLLVVCLTAGRLGLGLVNLYRVLLSECTVRRVFDGWPAQLVSRLYETPAHGTATSVIQMHSLLVACCL